MTEISTEKLQYTGRFHQFGIYFRKFLRMFVYQSDWVVLPIGAVILACELILCQRHLEQMASLRF